LGKADSSSHGLTAAHPAQSHTYEPKKAFYLSAFSLNKKPIFAKWQLLLRILILTGKR